MLAFAEMANRLFSPGMVLLLVLAGLYFSVGTGFFQFRLGDVFRQTLGSVFSKKKKAEKRGVTPFQAVSTALAGTLGTGNIVGVSTAIVSGGPGAVFWMVITAFLGMITKYAEVLLAVKHQVKGKDGVLRGGPMYYMKNALHMPLLGGVFAVLCITASFGIGNMVQANSAADALYSAFSLPRQIVGIGMAVLVALTTFGGVKRIAGVCEKLVPFMALFYLGACLTVVGINLEKVPEAMALIFEAAFSPRAAGGGLLGYSAASAIRFGVSRGIFTNEAGLGSAPIAHGGAEAESPVKQGLWGIFEVFLDTVVMCSLTALVILTSGLWDCGLDGAALTTAAFSSAIGKYASGFIAVSVLFFAFSSILGWYYYGSCCLEFLTQRRLPLRVYQLCFLAAVIIGSVMQIDAVWAFSDMANLMMFLPNILAIFLLGREVFRETAAYKNR